MVFRAPDAEELTQVALLSSELTTRGTVTVHPHRPGETSDDTLLRYLRSRNGNVRKAADKYTASVRWRESFGVDELRKKSPAEALGCDVGILRGILPHAQRGRDRWGGPLIFKHMGAQCRVRHAIVDMGATLDGIERYNVWLNETYLEALSAAGAREWSVVVDAAGWHIGLFDSYAFQFLQRTAKVDGSHYPELLHRMLIVNAPPMLAAAWRVIRTWVDPETRDKIDILSEGAPEHARARLLELAEPTELPAQYGGTAPPLPDWPERAGVAPLAGEPPAEAVPVRVVEVN